VIDSKWKGTFQPLFIQISKIFVKLGVKSNTITLIAFIIGILSGIYTGLGKLLLGVSFLWLSGFLDVIDGTTARLTGKSTKVGAYIDLTSDRLVEAAFILGFAWIFPENYFAYLLFFVSVIFNFSTFIAAGALFENKGKKSFHYDAGLAERTETFIVFTLMALFPQFSYYILMVFNIIIFVTAIIRFNRVLKYEKE